jgi:hypothetical protein
MDFIEEFWEPLDLIDDDPCAVFQNPQTVGEFFWRPQVGRVDRLIQEIDARNAGEAGLCPTTFPDTAEAEQEEALPRRGQKAAIVFVHTAVIIYGKMTVSYADIIFMFSVLRNGSSAEQKSTSITQQFAKPLRYRNFLRLVKIKIVAP